VTTILVAGARGIWTFDEGGTPGPTHLEGRSVSAATQDRDDLWAIVDGSELWRSVGGGPDAWERVAGVEGHSAKCLAFTDSMMVGTSEARLFRVSDEGAVAYEGFDRAEGRDGWYTPWGGPPDTRSLTEWGESVYVNVHVGGILRTTDRGETWTPTIDVDADVHQVATTYGLVLAACAGGLASSADQGTTWTTRTDGLDAVYSRAVTVCGDTLLLSTSTGPRGDRAALYRGAAAGGPFERCRGGLPEVFSDNIDTYCLDAHPDGSFVAFGTEDGLVFASNDAGSTWGELASGLPTVRRVLVLP
jgi:hypothetical protein